MKSTSIALLLVALAVSPASAQVLITEVWSGGDGDATPDWFELTNISGSPLDPSQYLYDDVSASLAENFEMRGITNLVPGESAVYLVAWHDDFDSFTDALNAFDAFWGVSGAYQVGYVYGEELDDNNMIEIVGGSGLGGGGDAVNVLQSPFITPLDTFEYDEELENRTWVRNFFTQGIEGATLGNYGAFTSVGTPTQVGSPGFFGGVPEPGSIVLLMVGTAAMAIVRRRS